MADVSKTKIISPIAIEFIVPESLLRDYENAPNHNAYFTNYFQASYIPDVKYGISIYPRDIDNHDEAWFNFGLEYSMKKKIEADFTFTIESANISVKKNHIFEEAEWIGIKCCSTEELFDPKNFVAGKLIIKMEGTLMTKKDEEENQEIEYYNPFDSSLCLALWKQEENKDFTIVVDGKEITAHKCILAARSPVFEKMFESGLKESKENKVNIEDFSFEIVEAAIKLCYHQSLVPTLSLEIKMKLLQFFDKYDIQQFKDFYETYLITVINELNVCRLTNASLLSNSKKLERKCTEFLRDCLQKTKPISDLESLDKDFALNLFKNAFCHVSEMKNW